MDKGAAPRLLALVAMARPSHLFLIGMVFISGWLMGVRESASYQLEAMVIGLVALWFAGSSVHYANEAADVLTDLRTIRTPFSGGSGATTGYPQARRHGILAMIISGCLAILTSGVGWRLGLLPGVSIVILSIGLLSGWMYSLPPFCLAWRGWGELANALLGGLALPLYGFTTQTGYVSTRVITAYLPFTGMVFLNLLATTWPDRHADGSAGKRTLATRWDPTKLRRLYWMVVGFILGTVITLAHLGYPEGIVVTSLALTPFMLLGGWTYTRLDNPLPSVATMVLMTTIQLTWILMVSE